MEYTARSTPEQNSRVEKSIVCRYEAFYGVTPAYAKHLHVFGEACVVHDKRIATKKMENRGKVMMFVGNSPQHAGNVCRTFDADTNRVVATRDAKFLSKMFYRSDYTRSELVPHANDIVLNRLHVPHDPPICDGSGDPVESDADDSLATTAEDPAEDGPEIDDLDEEPGPVTHPVRAWTDPENDQWQVAVNNEHLTLRRNQ